MSSSPNACTATTHSPDAQGPTPAAATAGARRRRWPRSPALAATGAGLMLVLAACSGGTAAATGTWGDSTAAQSPYLTLKSDGSLSGSDGCNRLIGSWRQSDATVTFSRLGSTMMACQGVDTWLSKAASATINGSTMTIKDAAEAKIGTLTRRT